MSLATIQIITENTSCCEAMYFSKQWLQGAACESLVQNRLVSDFLKFFLLYEQCVAYRNIFKIWLWKLCSKIIRVLRVFNRLLGCMKFYLIEFIFICYRWLYKSQKKAKWCRIYVRHPNRSRGNWGWKKEEKVLNHIDLY